MNDFELTVPDLYSLSKDSCSTDTCKLMAKGTDLFENSACISNGRVTKTSAHSPWGTCNLMHRILTTKHPGFCSQEICTIVQRFFIPFAVNVSTCIHYCSIHCWVFFLSQPFSELMKFIPALFFWSSWHDCQHNFWQLSVLVSGQFNFVRNY